MTTILVVKSGKTWTWAWDSQMSSGNRAETYSKKVFRRGEYIFGTSGAVKVANALKYATFPDYASDMDAEEHMITKLLPSLRKVLDKGKVLDNEMGDEYAQMSLLVQVGGRLFEVDSFLTVVEELSGIAGVGSGSDIARLAYEITGDIKAAMNWAVKKDLYTGGKITIRDDVNV